MTTVAIANYGYDNSMSQPTSIPATVEQARASITSLRYPLHVFLQADLSSIHPIKLELDTATFSKVADDNEFIIHLKPTKRYLVNVKISSIRKWTPRILED